jgi:hypothetical protein
VNFGFELRAKDQRHEFLVASEKELDVWIEALRTKVLQTDIW